MLQNQPTTGEEAPLGRGLAGGFTRYFFSGPRSATGGVRKLQFGEATFVYSASCADTWFSSIASAKATARKARRMAHIGNVGGKLIQRRYSLRVCDRVSPQKTYGRIVRSVRRKAPR